MRLDLTRIAAEIAARWSQENFLKCMREQSAPVKPFRGSETILLVEDEALIREITALVLKRLGYRVQEASSGDFQITPHPLAPFQSVGALSQLDNPHRRPGHHPIEHRR